MHIDIDCNLKRTTAFYKVDANLGNISFEIARNDCLGIKWKREKKIIKRNMKTVRDFVFSEVDANM